MTSSVPLGIPSEGNEPKYGENINKGETKLGLFFDEKLPANRSILVEDFLTNKHLAAL